MAERVLHELFPGDLVVIRPHSARSASSGASVYKNGFVTCVRAIEKPPYFWYCVRYAIKPGDRWYSGFKDMAWYSEEFLSSSRARPVEPTGELRVRVGSDVIIRDGVRRRDHPHGLLRVCEMFLDGYETHSMARLIEAQRRAHELTRCVLVDRRGVMETKPLSSLAVSVPGAVAAQHSWEPLTVSFALRNDRLQPEE